MMTKQDHAAEEAAHDERLTLYAIQQEYRALGQALIEADGELTPELEAALEFDAEAFAGKARGYCALIAEWAGHAEACRAEERRLADLRRRHERAADRLRARLLEAVQERGGRADLGLWRLSTRASSAVVVTVEPEALPVEYQRAKVEADKAAIKAALERGEQIEGAAIESRVSLVVK